MKNIYLNEYCTFRNIYYTSLEFEIYHFQSSQLQILVDTQALHLRFSPFLSWLFE